MESGGDKRRVVIVGGGIAGSLLAKSVQFNADVTLIDPKEYLEITWANLRNMVEPSFAERSVINHRDYLTNGRVVTSAAINITETEVLTTEGRLIGYDYLVIATGHYDPVPKTKEERLDQYQAENQKIQSANSILIVGGGPTGVELAGEIATDFPEKKITLVHKGPRLLEFIGLKAGDKALCWLKSRNVEVKLEQEVDLKSIPDGTEVYQTSMGETIEADCRYLCAGKPLATSWLSETILKDNLDKRGRLMVDEYLRVKGHKNIFAIGDITDVPELKQGYLAHKHALVVAKNLKVLMSGGKESKMSTYEPGSAIAMVSLGRKDAIAQFPFTTIGGCVPGYIKSRDLFIGRTRKQMGLPS
ncbi:FAD-dependent pyridine nucleotide-disulfide oxidoreductase [Corchorus olitorius]|uniref:FAD-dependent pyridine nucleotide-disulfide oxidoreductase n=1 Tax=Corchorus olitorius TaxID=93759 RepID=A0A1R3K9R2_9ROSI|nr:FAD-dependent pyridine nucleotide-disulfide oxidoreductase [Corchorus olitorius]